MAEGCRTLVLGFDALSFEYLDRFAAATPTLSGLRADGVTAPLESTVPPWTASAWPSMYTGADPSHHGVYSFFSYDYPDDGRLVTRNDVELPALWNYLSAEGSPSVVLNVPVTHPAEPIEGVLIPGYLAQEDEAGYPNGIRSELSTALDERYRIYSRAETSSDGAEKLAGYLDLIDQRKRAAVELLTTHEWELAVVQVQKTDAVFHNFDDEAAFRDVYAAADEFARAVIDAVDDPVNVVVCSDHGMAHKGGTQVYLNEILRRHGYLQATTGGDDLSLSTEKRRLIGADEDDGTGSSVAELLASTTDALSRVGVTPGRVYTLAERLGVESQLRRLVPSSIRRRAARSVDWSASTAYCPSKSVWGVRINLVGREPDGVVPRTEYERVRTELIDLLSGLETPAGSPVFDAVRPREAVYGGPEIGEAPDVVVRPRSEHVLSTRLYGRRFVPADVYDHDPEGVFVGAGPRFDHEAAPGTLSLTDVAPIVMALLGYPVPERMTGAVPSTALSVPSERADYGTVAYGTGRSDAGDESEVTDVLEDLGYL